MSQIPEAGVLPQAARSDGPRSNRQFRPDIQGVRAVAVLGVVLYHCSVRVISGGYAGVDVFFVISGFLITSHLFNELSTTGTISLTKFYSRRVRRLLVPAVVVLALTTAAAWLWGPKLDASQTAKDGVFSAAYLINYRLAKLAVDYQHASDDASPLQHYWSLSLEEQFYLLWPLILIGLALIVRRRKLREFGSALVVLVIACSLYLSITITPHEAWTAYFSLQTRAWELGIGAAVALALPWIRKVPPGLAAVVTWVGLALILFSFFVYDDNTDFPGYLALVPVLGAALVIAGGVVAPRLGAEAVLRPRPMQFFGKVSYGWYLWHWPVIIIVPQIIGQPVGAGIKLLLALGALGLAWLTFKFLEAPLLSVRLRPAVWLPTAVVASGTAAAICLALAFIPAIRINAAGVPNLTLSSADPQSTLEAQLKTALSNQIVPKNIDPSLTNAANDGRNPCRLDLLVVSAKDCVTGDASGKRTVVLMGDSHADQWYSGLNQLAQKNGWRLLAWTKVGCPIVGDYQIYLEQLKRDYTECTQWRDQRLQEISTIRPALVIVSQDDLLGLDNYTPQQWGEQTGKTVKTLVKVSGKVVFLGDTPHPFQSIPECLAENLQSATVCNFTDPLTAGSTSPNAIQAERRVQVARAVTAAGGTYLDVAPWFCLENECPVLLQNVLLYRDDNHITSRASRLMEPLLQAALFATQ